MNDHLLPLQYRSSQTPSWLERAVQPLCNLLFGGPTRSTPQRPSPPSNSLPRRNSGDILPPLRIICVSDTHNATPPLPPGDILIHAGDLTAHGTFDEVQAQLRWLSSHPHAHKIVIAGNHDILLDEASDMTFLVCKEDSAAKRKELDWGGIWYLQDEAVTLEFPTPGLGLEPEQVRRVKIYGCPLTPELGRWAFQYPAIRDVWTGRVPDDTDILVVHGPPALYGDWDGEKDSAGKAKVKGDGYLLQEIRRVEPRMVICGHIHGAYGLVTIRHDGIQSVVNKLQMRWEGYGLFGALQQILWGYIIPRRPAEYPSETLVVNAATAPSGFETEAKPPIVIDFH